MSATSILQQNMVYFIMKNEISQKALILCHLLTEHHLFHLILIQSFSDFTFFLSLKNTPPFPPSQMMFILLI